MNETYNGFIIKTQMDTTHKKLLFLSGGIIGILAAALLVLFSVQKPSPVLEAPNLLGSRERITILGPQGETVVIAKIDTGADSSSVDTELVAFLDLKIDPDKKKTVITSEGSEERNVVDFEFLLGETKIKTSATIGNRSDLSTPVLIGKADLEGFIVDPSREFILPASRQPLPLLGTTAESASGTPLHKLLIIFPILGSVIVFLRLFVGIRTYGVFAPVVIAFSLMQIGIANGLAVYIVLIMANMGIKIFLINHLNMPHIAEFSLLMFALSAILVLASGLGNGLLLFSSGILFPLIITSHLIERAYKTIEETGFADAAVLLAYTLTTAVIGAFLGTRLFGEPISFLWIAFAASISAVIILGNYTGLRLSEFFRFRVLQEKHEHL